MRPARPSHPARGDLFVYGKNYGNLRVSCQDQPPLTWKLCFPTDHYIAKHYSLLTFSTSVHSQWDDITPSSGGVFKLFAACSRLDYFDHSLPVAVDCCDEEVLVSVSVWLRNMLHSILFSDNFLRVITYHCDHLSTISGYISTLYSGKFNLRNHKNLKKKFGVICSYNCD